MRRLRSRTSHVTLASLALVAAATAGAQTTGENGAALEKCDKPIGTLAVVEPQDEVITALTRYRLQSPTGLIRLMVQQSNCFQVVERGAGMRNIMQERELAQSGQLQTASNVGGGQLRAADFVLTPNVLFSEGNAGGVGGAVGGAGGYTNTNEGKVVAASFLDNYNAIVRAVRADPSLQRMAAAPGGAAAAGAKAGAVFAEGDVLVPKIANVKVFAAPAESGRAVGVLGKTDELVCTGEERNGYVKVQSGSVEGWVRKTLVRKQ
jgi:curli biogenesis system outer membrane secretion channel CsgG